MVQGIEGVLVNGNIRRMRRVCSVLLAAHLIAVDAFKLSQGVVATRASPPCPFRSSFPSGYCRYDRRSRSVATRAVPPQAETRGGWREIWLDGRAPGSKSDARSLVQNFERGASVLQLDGVASDAECLALVEAAKKRAAAGTVRIPSMAAARRKVRQIGGTEEDLSPLPDAADATAEAIFQRVLTRIEDELPSLVTTLFSTDETSKCNLTARHATGTLLFNNMEPAVNVYTNKGLNGLPPHKDRMALTVLLSLSPPTSFAGGGTGFWRDKANCGPTAVLRPAPGTVLLWGGEVMHAGMPMESGTRCVRRVLQRSQTSLFSLS
jgi:hypothetical protein